MKFNTLLPFILLTLLPSSTRASCLPCARGNADDVSNGAKNITSADSRRTVWDPAITNPTSQTTWVVGSDAKVTWDTSKMPAHVTNPKGRIVLGYLTSEGSSEHLDFEHPLADGFDLSQGSMAVHVPNVQDGSDYIVVLFGDSGNRSPTFRIVNSSS